MKDAGVDSVGVKKERENLSLRIGRKGEGRLVSTEVSLVACLA